MSTPRKPGAKGLTGANVLRAQAVALKAQGMTGRDIAEALDVHEATVSKWLQEPPVVAALESTKAKAIAMAEAHAVKAIETLVEIMHEAEYASDRRGAATALLDRIGIVAGTKIEHAGSIASRVSLDDDALRKRVSEIMERRRGSRG